MSATWQDVVDHHERRRARQAARDRNPHVPDVSLPVSDVVTYTTLSITEVVPGTRERVEDDEPLDLLGGAATTHATAPAVGVMLHVEQGWREAGLGIGRLQHSLCLAPGEVTQVAMTGWERGTHGNTREVVGEQEAASQAADRSRDTADVTHGVAAEIQRGGSSYSAVSIHASGATGGLMSAFVASGSAAHSSSVAFGASWSTGSRHATVDSRQRVRQHTAQHASNARSRAATLVSEVSREESEQFKTRVVANYNHMHALNLQYYEMLQVYELSARPVRAERCIFLPMRVGDLDPGIIVDRAADLVAAAQALGRGELADQVAAFAEKHTETSRSMADLVARRDRLREQVEQLEQQLDRQGRLEAMELERAELQRVHEQLVAERERAEHALQLMRDLEGRLEQIDEELGEQSMSTSESGEPEIVAIDVKVLDEQSRLMAQLQEILEGRPERVLEDVARRTEELEEAGRRLDDAMVAAAEPLPGDQEGRLREELDFSRRDAGEVSAQLEKLEATRLEETSRLWEAMRSDRLALHQALWAGLDPPTVETMVAGYELRGESIADTIDPEPVAIIGNYVGFRWAFPDDDDGQRRRADFEQRYLHEHAEPASDTHVLPAGGLFLEAVLGTANAAEKLDLTRFWRWDDDTIPILPTAIEQLKHRRHGERAEARPGELGDPAVRRQDLGDLPAGPSHAATAAIGRSMFRDMSGQELVQGLLETVSEATQEHMEATQTQAQEAIGAWLDHVEEVLPKVLEAVGSGDLDPSNLGSLANAFGEGGEINPEALLSIAAEVGVLL